MKRLWKAGYLVAVVAMPLGVGMLIGGLIMGHFLDEFGMFWNPLTPQGAAWLAVGLIGLVFAAKGRGRLRRLKDDGLRFDAEVTQVGHRTIPIRTGTGAAGRVECVYINDRGERCLVKSRSLLLRFGDNAENLGAVVYVDRDDPARYEVEVFRKDSVGVLVDRDYR
jgi:MFS family permease